MSARTDGFDEFFDAHYDPVVRALALAFGDRPRAEDATQEAFARALRRWPRVRTMDRPVGWVYVVAANVARRSAKRERREESVAVGAEPSSDVAGPVVTRVSLREALALLPARQRQVVVRRYLADLSVDDTAQAMGCAPGTVKSTLHAALSAMRIELEDDGAER